MVLFGFGKISFKKQHFCHSNKRALRGTNPNQPKPCAGREIQEGKYREGSIAKPSSLNSRACKLHQQQTRQCAVQGEGRDRQPSSCTAPGKGRNQLGHCRATLCSLTRARHGAGSREQRGALVSAESCSDQAHTALLEITLLIYP